MINKQKYGDNRIYELKTDEDKILSTLNIYLPFFLKFLWERPEIIALLLINSNIEDIKKTLAPLIANNFYTNILSSKHIEDNLMYLITILLKEEIGKLIYFFKPENFLDNNSPCCILLFQLRYKINSQSFIKNIIEEPIEQLESLCSSYNINFDLEKISENVNDMMTELQYKSIKRAVTCVINKDELKTKILDSRLNRNKLNNKEKIDVSAFTSKYLKNLDDKVIKKENNLFMKTYFSKTTAENIKTLNSYTNDLFIKKINNESYKKEILSIYVNDFSIVQNFIDKIIKNLLDNINLIPYSIKTICKIISELIKKRFENISVFEHNAFIGRFFFRILFTPILKNPNSDALISDYIISGKTISNLTIIIDIFLKLINGKLYSNKENLNLTPFNRFIIEKQEKLLEIFGNLTDIKLPNFIEKLINDELKEDYQFNIFKENPEEILFHRSICFTIYDLTEFIKNIYKCRDKILIDKNKDFAAVLEKISTNENPVLIQKIRDMENAKKDESKLFYFLISDLMINPKYENFFYPENNNSKKKPPVTEEERKFNLISTIKELLIKFLLNYKLLVKEDFTEESLIDIKKLFNELQNFAKIQNNFISDNIPSEWYINSIIESLPKLPIYLTENNCLKLLQEIKYQISKSIKELDFEKMSFLIGKIDLAKRNTEYLERKKIVIKDIDLNKKAKNIIQNDQIGVAISFKFGEFHPFFIIEKIGDYSLNGFSVIENINDNFHTQSIQCSTIESFTENFPYIPGEINDQENLLEIEEKLEIPKALNFYFTVINEHLDKNYSNIENDDLKQIKIKINDYIMAKLYDNIFPKEPDKIDLEIYQKLHSLSWIEPKHFIQEIMPSSLYNSFLPDAIKFFKLILKEKTPRKKLENLSKVMDSINQILLFNSNNGTPIGVDDHLPLLQYALIKANPLKIGSNIKFMELYIFDSKGKQALCLRELQTVYLAVSNLSCKDLKNVTEEIYNTKCNEANKLKKKISC